jgi:hypothetical protein
LHLIAWLQATGSDVVAQALDELIIEGNRTALVEHDSNAFG